MTHDVPVRRTGSWFDHRFRSSTASFSLYCFPFAGGAASFYSEWSQQVGGAVELVPVQLPGRGARMAEPPPDTIEEVADQVTEAVLRTETLPLLFGHSMGAIIAFEVARRLDAAARPVVHLFVSGRPAPRHLRPVVPISDLPRDRFVQVLRDYGAADEQILDNEQLLDVLMPMMRADFGAIETYRYTPGPLLTCPISAWCGTEDQEVSPDTMLDWADVTAGGVKLFVRSGGHFFLSDHVAEILRTVDEEAAATRQHRRPGPVQHGGTAADGGRSAAGSGARSADGRVSVAG